VDVRQANELYELAKSLETQATELRHALEWEFLTGQLVEVFTTDYDLGKVVRVEEITGGYVNLSFAIWADDGSGERRFFVRKYNRAITEREVRFEHALVSHINDKGFRMAAQVFPTRDRGTFVTLEEILDGEPLTRYFAVYEMLTGQDKYTWVKNRCTDRELESAARVLAQFHHSAHDFDPRGFAREQPPIMEMLRDLPATFKECAGHATDTRCDEYFLAKLPAVLDVIDKGVAIEPLLSGMPFIPVHCDFHPGNLKWVDQEAVAMRPVEWSGSSCTGFFDFDWSKLDYRLFDVGQGVAYFCTSWEGADSGKLWLDKAALFVGAYQDEAAKYDQPGPMSAAELELLPRMIANANIYILNWDVTAYYEDKDARNDDEYLMYLEHQIKVMEFIESHVEELARITASAAPVAAPGPSGESEVSV
jgi:homoserine kinase type II